MSSRPSTDLVAVHKFAPHRVVQRSIAHPGAMRTPYGYELPRILTAPRAASLGVSRSRVRTELRRGNWRRIATGVLLTVPDAPTRFDWCEAGLVLAGPGAALSGWDAVGLHGMRVQPPAGASVLVLVRTCRSRRFGPVLIRRTERPYRSALTPAEHPVFPLRWSRRLARSRTPVSCPPMSAGYVRSSRARFNSVAARRKRWPPSSREVRAAAAARCDERSPRWLPARGPPPRRQRPHDCADRGCPLSS